MQLDIRTLVFVLGITHIIQVVIFTHQSLTNKTFRGIGWWAMWSIAEVMAFASMFLRGIPSIHLIAIICQNVLLIAGVFFIYIGIMRFLDKKENRVLIVSVFVLFVAALLYFVYVNNNIQVRGIIISVTLAFVSFLSAQALFINKVHAVNASANFTSAIFVVHGCYFMFRAAMMFAGAPIPNLFIPTLLNVTAYLDAIIVSILWTFGFIIMINQRLNAEMVEAKEEMDLVFNTSPDAAIISRLSDGSIVYVNEGFSALSGFTRDESIGKSTSDLKIWQNSDDRQKVITQLQEKGSCENVEAVFQHKDGSQLSGIISAKIIALQGAPHIISVTRDITDRKLAEDQVKSLLAEKELLLREVHHRIKNNMNVITSLLSLQADTLNDPSAIAALQDSQNRVRSMMVLYDKLYRSADFREISAKEYLTSLIDEIIRNFPNHGPVTVEKQIDDFILDAKTLSPLGMILNELLTNTMKHAFIGRDKGIMGVFFSVKDNHATLIVQDNGIGIPESIHIANSSTGFGMQLVGLLAEQLEGSMKVERNNGTKFVLEFDI